MNWAWRADLNALAWSRNTLQKKNVIRDPNESKKKLSWSNQQRVGGVHNNNNQMFVTTAVVLLVHSEQRNATRDELDITEFDVALSGGFSMRQWMQRARIRKS